MTYLVLKLVLFPAIRLTGLLYLTYNFWGSGPAAGAWLPLVADLHLLAAFAIAAFVVVHVYLLTVGGSFAGHVRPMLTGFDRVALTPEERPTRKPTSPAV